jgi:4-amino-4-deoxy-L-arabinose transferase-like glycosyltransferase
VFKYVNQLGLASLLVVSLGLRLLWGLLQPTEIDTRLPDQHEYLSLARSLFNGNGLRFFDERFGQYVYAFRTPGYPLFLTACGANVHVVRIVQAMLDTGTVLAVYLLARQWLAAGPSLLAAGLIAFNPFLIYFSALILSETLFTALLTWGMLLLIGRRTFLWGGITLAASVSVRPAAFFLPLLIGFVTSCNQYKRITPNKGLAGSALFFLLTLAVLTPWAVRNRVVLGEWIWLTTNSGITRYDGFNPNATGASDQRFLQHQEMDNLRSMNELERDELLSRQASDWINKTWKTEPGRLITLTLTKIARTWSPVPLSAEFGSRKIYQFAAMIYSIPFDILIIVGLLWGKIPVRIKIFLIVPAVYFTLVHALSVGSLRYRIPVEPILALLAALAAEKFWSFRATRLACKPRI